MYVKGDKGKRILMVGFWGGNDPLTRSSLVPTISYLLASGWASTVVLITLERSVLQGPVQGLPDGVVHVPFHSWRWLPGRLSRSTDLLLMRHRIGRLIREEAIDCVVARSTMAGMMALSPARSARIPLVIESVEPHTDYMVDCGEWKADGLFARFVERSESAQHAYAHRLMSVTENYKRRLVREGVPPHIIHVVPCPVDHDRFAFNEAARRSIRGRSGWEDELVGVYAGKFGGLYHEEAAYRTFATAFGQIGERFRLLVLTPSDIDGVRSGMAAAGVPLEKVIVKRVPHDQVADHLSAADLAFSLYRATPSSAFLSPVKNGEYWSNGLPVLLTRSVSDDSDLIDAEPEAGAVFDPEGDDLPAALDRVLGRIARPGQRERTRAFGMAARSPEFLSRAYQEAMSSLTDQTDELPERST